VENFEIHQGARQENQMNPKSFRRRGTVAGLALALIAGGAIGAVGMSQHDRQETTAHITLASAPSPAIANSISFTNGFASVVKSTLPAVVNISSTKLVKQRSQEMPFFNDPFFQQFFGPDGQDQGQGQGQGRRFHQQQPQQPERQMKEYALGSGVIVSPEGYILTNNHVVEGATDITVDLSDRRHFTAKLIGTDPLTDVAVIKINADNLTAMPLGHSNTLQVGDFVLAIGDPFGVGESVSMGIVSATGRTNQGIEGNGAYEDFIQTDAAINHGNSGGALVDVHGELVGINTAILTGGSEMGGGGEGNAGVGFAVPIDLARHVMMQLIEHGKVVRAEIGAHIQGVTPPLAQQFGLPKAEGAIILDTLPGGPAAKAGLKQGDVILGMNGTEYPDYSELRNAISMQEPGSTVTLQVMRDGKPMQVKVTLDTLQPEQAAANDEEGGNDNGNQGEGNNWQSSGAMSGVSVQNLTPAIAKQMNLGADTQGVLINQIDDNSDAAGAGLDRGDVITSVNRQPVHNVQEYRQALSHAGSSVLLTFVQPNSNGVPNYVVVGKGQ
jgi:serine protease Do